MQDLPAHVAAELHAVSSLNRTAVERRLREVAVRAAGARLDEAVKPPGDPALFESVDVIPTCGRTPRPARYWRDFLCEPVDKLLQTAVVAPGAGRDVEAPVDYEYLCNETNVLDRLFKVRREGGVGRGAVALSAALSRTTTTAIPRWGRRATACGRRWPISCASTEWCWQQPLFRSGACSGCGTMR